MDHEGDVDEPTRSVVVGESDTESLNGGASSASATDEVPDIPEPGMAFEDVRVNSREIRGTSKSCFHEGPCWSAGSTISRRVVGMF